MPPSSSLALGHRLLLLLLLATIFQKRLFSKTWTPTLLPTCLLKCAGIFFPILDFSLSIHYSRLSKKEAETKSGFSPRERRRRRSRLLCTTRRESSSSLYTRFPKSSCFCAHHHRRSRGVVRDEAALFGTRASILRVFLFAFKRTREREETFFFFESPHKKVYSKISR